MKLNSITPNKIDKGLEAITKKAKDVTDTITMRLPETKPVFQISPARMHLELNAESMSPNEYIAARSYISSLEMDELIASEMKTLR